MQASGTKRTSVRDFLGAKNKGEPIVMLTAYDYTMAQLLDSTKSIDGLLVGDSAANVMAGYETTLPITLSQMIYHAQSVVRATKHALVVVDMPFGSYQESASHAVRAATRIMKSTQAHAVKLEGGYEIEAQIHALLKAGIPVMGHLGLKPQSVHQTGYKAQGLNKESAETLVKEAQLLSNLGCFALVLERVQPKVAQNIRQQCSCAVIGIGSGNNLDGQILVTQDMLGMNDMSQKLRFVKAYAELKKTIQHAATSYAKDVRGGTFPNSQEW